MPFFKKLSSHTWYFLIGSFCWNSQLYKCSTILTHITLLEETRSCFLYWKFISRIRFEDADVKRQLMTQLHTRLNEEFQKCFINGKLAGIIVLNLKWTILIKMNISFFIHFCFHKHSFSLNTFWTRVLYIFLKYSLK